MTETLDGVTKKTKPEPTAEERAAEDMVRRAREQGLSLTGPDGSLKHLTKTVLETALHAVGRLTLCRHASDRRDGQAARRQQLGCR
jgi:hypothetical protein